MILDHDPRNPLSGPLALALATCVFLLFALVMARIDLRREQARRDRVPVIQVEFPAHWAQTDYLKGRVTP